MGYKKFKECLAKNAGTGECSGKMHGKFCGRHRYHLRRGKIDKNGKKILNFIPIIYKECIAKNAGFGKCQGEKSGSFCKKHWTYHSRGKIDKNGKKILNINKLKYKECLAKNAGTGECTTRKGGKFCTMHNGQYYKHKIIDENGKKLRDLIIKTKNKECIAKNAGTDKCSGKMHGKFCTMHNGQYYKYKIIDENGKRLRLKSQELICIYPKCNKHGGNKYGYCKKHYYEVIVRNDFSYMLYEGLKEMNWVEQNKMFG